VRLALAGILLLSAACATPPTGMRVSLAPPIYTPAMSSALGIGLLPVAAPPSGVKVRYRWHADRGRFKSWEEFTHEIVDLGPDAVNDGEKLYWAYGASDMTGMPPVNIVIYAEDAKSGKPLAETVVRLEWDGEFVRVAR